MKENFDLISDMFPSLDTLGDKGDKIIRSFNGNTLELVLIKEIEGTYELFLTSKIGTVIINEYTIEMDYSKRIANVKNYSNRRKFSPGTTVNSLLLNAFLTKITGKDETLEATLINRPTVLFDEN